MLCRGLMINYLICSANHKVDLLHPFNWHKKAGDRCNALISYDIMSGARYCRRILRKPEAKRGVTIARDSERN